MMSKSEDFYDEYNRIEGKIKADGEIKKLAKVLRWAIEGVVAPQPHMYLSTKGYNLAMREWENNLSDAKRVLSEIMEKE
jgi:hypothetical protein